MGNRRTVVITGASSGIGAALARHYNAKGWNVGLIARRQERLAALVKDLTAGGTSGKAVAATGDVTDLESLKGAVAEVREALGPIDLAIANAGVSNPLPAHRWDSEVAKRIFAVNVHGVWHTVEAVLPAMLRRGSGHLVAISSLAAFKSFPVHHVYAASKSAVNAQMEGLRQELAGKGVDVTTICPGFVHSEMTAKNKFPMPFIMPADRAAGLIYRAVERRAKEYAFPGSMRLLMRLGPLIPAGLTRRFSGIEQPST